MRLRSRSIRAKIIALLMVPIVALTGLWVYATLVTTGDAWTQLDVSAAYRSFSAPTDEYARDLQDERRAAVLTLADPASQPAKDTYLQAQAVTDRDLQLLRYQASGSADSKLDRSQRARFQSILNAADQLAALRGQVNRAANSWGYVIGQYGDLIEPVFGFRSSFVSRQSGQLPRQGMILIELMRAREYLSQEDAAIEGLRVTGSPDERMVQAALDGLHNQRALFAIYISELDPQDQADYRDLQISSNWTYLSNDEAFFEASGDRAQAAKDPSQTSYHDLASSALHDLADLNTRLGDTIAARATAYTDNALVRGGVAGLVGLIGVVLSIVVSYRIGRGLARELIGLRNAALEISGTRLPAVMLRLRRGEAVDVEAEAPALEFGGAEIGQVGQAFNEVQRAAFQAAVEQAELRRGVSAVFVNLARRSQVLLHRQLTLLDTMERRTENATELEDLFRLDHLTTRMRRHAEGLIILSGGSPGRAWRKPVRMVDVVRAAVGEVEDYARVIVRPFPGTGLMGSAVADVTHLIAELVENAAVYSPPQTQVTVQGEVVAHGFCLEIDDRGLGLSEQALAEINQRLAVEQEFDLADTDRLGLFVVSRLARRHGIRVHLRPSPYGGTAAVVLIPRELLAEAVDQGLDPSAAAAPPVPAAGAKPAVRRGRRELVAVPALAEDSGHRHSAGAPVTADEPVRSSPRPIGGPRPAVAEPARTPGGLPRRRASSGGTGRHRRAGEEAAAEPQGQAGPAPAAPAPAHAAPIPAGGLLPRRVRQANLAPQLKAATPEESADPGRERSPEEARSTFASFQRGYKRGRGDRLQPASLTVVPDSPDSPDSPAATPAAPAVPTAPVAPAVQPTPEPPRPRAALTPSPVPQALAAAPAQHALPAAPVPKAQPVSAEGTES
ncbi:nitrate- and nitrite sensing domain-containing protein [Kitasatospora sp. MAP5-34]|uniref:sensor histidine kinase n=1 Tax=Kitasatospora sp. MAP5-34 TaxID=3035102 RepID=UPI0024767076|nr:nitrate- and nitrite sensing domain-containing protein [Kitasatospora sp. MAP5-34]MDH6575250.1 signal transduction histidine kinase [Kitasatospora sp. MAP5-34]